MRIEAKPPDKWQPVERAAFEALVAKGGEVETNGLSARIMSAYRLVLAFDDDKLVGVGALKHPKGHRDTVARESNVPLNAKDYPLELGWFYVEERLRKAGIASDMLSKLMLDVTAGVYATSHTSNKGMHKVLQRSGFEPAGRIYESKLHPGIKIRLFQKPRIDLKQTTHPQPNERDAT
jgi:GNAT superfamily N-acetyltransferase